MFGHGETLICAHPDVGLCGIKRGRGSSGADRYGHSAACIAESSANTQAFWSNQAVGIVLFFFFCPKPNTGLVRSLQSYKLGVALTAAGLGQRDDVTVWFLWQQRRRNEN